MERPRWYLTVLGLFFAVSAFGETAGGAGLAQALLGGYLGRAPSFAGGAFAGGVLHLWFGDVDFSARRALVAAAGGGMGGLLTVLGGELVAAGWPRLAWLGSEPAGLGLALAGGCFWEALVAAIRKLPPRLGDIGAAVIRRRAR